MILNVSGRCDVVGFYMDWFMRRYEEGFVDTRNPFNKELVSRIYFEDVDLICFCTKNPTPLLPHLKTFKEPIIVHVTLTPYHSDIEVNVPDKRQTIEAIKIISREIGKENIILRYDPIFLSDRYTLAYHLKAFQALCEKLDGYVETVVVSWLDECKNVLNNKHILNYQELSEDDYRALGEGFSKAAREHGMHVQTCSEARHLAEYGFEIGDCLSQARAFQLTGKKYPKWSGRNNKYCNCAQMVDIADYNCCPHLCRYCYANYDEVQVMKRTQAHNPNSSLLIGELKEDDIIKVRK